MSSRLVLPTAPTAMTSLLIRARARTSLTKPSAGLSMMIVSKRSASPSIRRRMESLSNNSAGFGGIGPLGSIQSTRSGMRSPATGISTSAELSG